MDYRAVRDAGGIFYISHSGGKDSQAMYALLRQRIPFDQDSRCPFRFRGSGMAGRPRPYPQHYRPSALRGAG